MSRIPALIRLGAMVSTLLMMAPCLAETAPSELEIQQAKFPILAQQHRDAMHNIREATDLNSECLIRMDIIRLKEDMNETLLKIIAMTGSGDSTRQFYVSEQDGFPEVIANEKNNFANRCNEASFRAKLDALNASIAEESAKARSHFDSIVSSFDDGRGPGCYQVTLSIDHYQLMQRDVNLAIPLSNRLGNPTSGLTADLADIQSRLDYAEGLRSTECTDEQLAQIRSTSQQFQDFVREGNERTAREIEAARRAQAAEAANATANSRSNPCGFAYSCTLGQGAEAKTYRGGKRVLSGRDLETCQLHPGLPMCEEAR